MAASLTPVTSGARHRLTNHYGPSASRWLDSVPGAIDAAAAAWKLTVTGYHDAGWTSVIALAHDSGRQPYAVKAWYDPGRYRREMEALRRWGPPLAADVAQAADHLAVAALRLVAGRPGGAPAPADEYAAVADGLRQLHAAASAPADFPTLTRYVVADILPRIYRRIAAIGAQIPESCLRQGMAAVSRLPARLREPVILHGDLYRENVLFQCDGRPVFIDPHPLAGDPVFDWAFWTVYYDLSRDPTERLLTAVGAGGISIAQLLPWCLTLCLDGLLYYTEIADPRAAKMPAAMAALASIWKAAGL